MARQVLNGLKNLFYKMGKVGSQRLNDGSVVFSIAAIEVLQSCINRMFQKNCGAIIERVGAGNIRPNPGDIDGERAKERARFTKRIDGRSEILSVSGQGGFSRCTRTADITIPFEHRRLVASRCQHNRCR
jgi:hypothetical protein